MYAIIGGTGVYKVKDKVTVVNVITPYGEVQLDKLEMDSFPIYFLSRHGKNHSTPPHKVNYRANIKALEMVGVKYVFSTVAVGSMNDNYAPGDLVLINDFIDFTKLREVTFFDGDDGVKHVDMSEPYCHVLSGLIQDHCGEFGLKIKGQATYLTTEGPRFETKAEINMYKNFADVVGMTNVPEVVLAKELGMCYATVGIITNWCTGFKSEIAIHEIQSSIYSNKDALTQMFISIFKNQNLNKNQCQCEHALIKL